MKTKNKNIIILLAIGLIFPIILNNNLNFSVEKTTFNNLNTSSVYNGGIMIDGLATTNTSYSGNWTWAVSQPWCYDDNGVYVIEDLTINASTSPTGSGIYILDSDNEYFIIRNCTVYDAGSGVFNAGIKLEDTNNGTLTNNNCFNNPRYGIYLEDCNYNTISGNTANNNTVVGINLYFCYNNTVSGNIANYNQDAIYIEESDDNTVSGNTANGNSQFGIYSYFCFYNNITGNTFNDNEIGIYIDDSDNNKITGNTANYNLDAIWIDGSDYNTLSGNIISNNQDGIFIYDALNNTIIDNTVRNNYVRGIHLDEDSDYQEITENVIYNNTIGINIDGLNDNNLVYKNFFLNNGKHAFDDGTANKWNNTVIGNYWDNHTAPDTTPQDGIVDNPYLFIEGSVESIDYLPIAEDGAPRITIISPSGGEKFDSTAPSLNVEVIDLYVYEMWYTLDGGLNNYTFTANGTINQTGWDTLPEGNVTITFYAMDIAENLGFEEVIVIKDISAGGLDPGVLAVIVALSVIGGIALLGAILGILVKKGKISLEKIKGLSFRRK